MKTCDECANYECDNFDGVGWCNLNKAMVLHDDPTCKEFHELPDDGENNRITITLEERAKEAWDNYEYREGELYQNCFTDGFIAGVKYEQEHRPITLPEYQLRAMSTCLSTCSNFSYMMLNLVGEVGELASKVAKAIRKGEATTSNGHLRHPSTRRIDDDLEEAMMLESGDILWELAGLCSVMGWDLEKIAQMNLDKLASRQQRGVIEGGGDNR